MDKKSILGKINKSEDRLLVAGILDKAAQAEKLWKYAYTDFLDPYQQKLAERALQSMKCSAWTFDGGYKDAERAVVIFFPGLNPQDDIELVEKPFSLINVELKTEANLSHRDYLGALLGLGIKREKVGDIIVRKESGSIIVLKEVADYIIYNLDQVGRVGVAATLGEIENLEVPAVKTKEIKCTVPSLRIDCIVSNGFGISRSKAMPLFSSERVYLNWEVEKKPSAQVKEGDTVSVRGMGRVIVSEISGLTRKGRISVVLKRLV